MKKANFFRLNLKKIRRTIIRSPLQFLAVIIITALASTLFLGLSSSANSLNNRVQTVYSGGNVADITTTIDSPDSSLTDFKNIQSIVADNGKVESRNYSSGALNSYSNYICLSDEYPTISKPYSTSKEVKDNYFYICERYILDTYTFGDGTADKWIDKDGNFKPVEVKINISSLHKDYSSNKVITYLDSLAAKQSKSNILNNDFLYLSITPTGTMLSPENIVRTEDNSPVSLLSKSLFNSVLSKTLIDTYGKDIAEPSKGTEEHKAWELITNPNEKITKTYFIDNQYVTRLNNRNEADAYVKKIDEYFATKGDDNNLLLNVTLAKNQTNLILTNDLEQSKMLAISISALFFLVSILVVATTLSQLISKERIEIGTQKALGISNKRIVAYYIGLTFIIALIGIIVGIIAGPLIIPTIMEVKVNLLYLVSSYSYTFPVAEAFILIGVTLGILFLITYLVTRKEIKLLPAESMRVKTSKSISLFKKQNTKIALYKYILSREKVSKKTIINNIKSGLVKINGEICKDYKYKVNLLEDDVKYNDKKIIYHYENNSIPLKLAIRNLFHSIPRSLMVIIGVLGCTALLGAGFGIDNSISYSAEHDFRNYFGKADMILRISNINPYNKVTELASGTNKKIESYDAYAHLPTHVILKSKPDVDYPTYVFAVNPVSEFFTFTDEPNNPKPKGDKIFVSKMIADALNLKVDSLVTFNVFGTSYSAVVSKIVDNFYVQGIFVSCLHYTKFMDYLSNIMIKVHTGNSSVNEITNIFKADNDVNQIMGINELRSNMENVSSSLKTITLILKVFAIALAIVVIYNLTLLNYNECSRNIATMKVLGFSRLQTSLSVVIEMMILSIIGIALGLSLTYISTSFLISINQTSIVQILIFVSPLTYLYGFIITLLTALLVNGFLGFRVKKIKMVESLKSIE